MAGLFNTLNLGARSMQAQQLGIEVTGQNISNVNNTAYSRQRVVVQTAYARQSEVGPIGTGVQAVAIRQIRDAVYDRQLESETSITSYLETQQKALDFLQTYLGEQVDNQGSNDANGVLSSSGIASSIQSLFDSFQQVASNPSSLSDRNILLQNAQTLAEKLNQFSANIDSLHSHLNDSAQSDVNNANDLLQSIAGLNKEITQQEFDEGGRANDLRDLRQQKLMELANYVKFDTSEDSNGELNISINGNLLVSGANLVDTLQTYDDGNGNLLVRLAGSLTQVPSTGGSIQGAIDARDQTLVAVKLNIDTIAKQLIDEVNTVHTNGFGLNGTTGEVFFTGTDAATIKVNTNLVDNPSLVQLSDAADAPTSNTIANELFKLSSKKLTGLNNLTIGNGYNSIVENVGSELSKVNQQLDDQNKIKALIQNKQSSVSGVSIDEEMTELMKFQRAYEASAKLITTVDDLLDTVINMKR